jgi:hypothetical protein
MDHPPLIEEVSLDNIKEIVIETVHGRRQNLQAPQEIVIRDNGGDCRHQTDGRRDQCL